jgi:uncharacterized protein with HEPN domain
MPRSSIEYLRHILEEAEYLINRSRGLAEEDFLNNPTLRRAFVRSLEVIGEAAKQIPMEMREKYSDIDWRAMTGMRDKLIHHYFGVDYDLVWDVVMNKIPSVSQAVRKIIEFESEGANAAQGESD